MSGEDFLSRWSRRKVQARKGDAVEEPPRAAPEVPASAPQGGATAVAPAPVEEPPLPAVESLTLDSDFAAFMKPQVDRGLRNQAMRALFSDPRFNVMDGLDVYIDDYTKADPLPEGWLEKMSQMARLGAYEPKVADPAQVAEEATPAQAAPADDVQTAEAPPPEAVPHEVAPMDVPPSGTNGIT